MQRFIFSILFPGFLCALNGEQWFKGNTHAHTTICGHADSKPDVVAGWYHDHGYNFLILSEHNHFIDPATVKLPEKVRKDFLLIPGEEVTGHKVIHTTAMNIDHLVPWNFDHHERSKIIQNHVDETRKAGGTTILNHPNFRWAVKPEDILPVDHLYMFELYNGHPAVANFGDAHHMSTEEQWDHLLTAGMKIYAVASDDAHHFAKWGDRQSNPGRGWVMVKANKLDPHTITHAMLDGDFYATSGVLLKNVNLLNNALHIEVDTCATEQELKSPVLPGSRVREGVSGYKIEFIGPEGKILKTASGTKAQFAMSDCHAYVRCKISLLKQGEGNKLRAYYAWTQPVFTDGRR